MNLAGDLGGRRAGMLQFGAAPALPRTPGAVSPRSSSSSSNHPALFTDPSFSCCLIFQLEKVSRHASPSITQGERQTLGRQRAHQAAHKLRKCLRKGGGGREGKRKKKKKGNIQINEPAGNGDLAGSDPALRRRPGRRSSTRCTAGAGFS